MGLGGIPASERVHIGFFGMRNAGKSSLINAVTDQGVSIVSDTPGTTTDPVSKTMEILPIGPVVIIDTPGIDDVGELGEMRVKRAYETLDRCDFAVVVIDITAGKSKEDIALINLIKQKKIPFLICYNKADNGEVVSDNKNEIFVSAKNNINISLLKERIAEIVSQRIEKYIISDRINKGDIVILVIPIDSGAPKGRIILPQQQVLREVLDCEGICLSVQPSVLKQTFESLNVKPKIVITDSQTFGEVSDLVPEDIFLTSFSILFMNYKGELSLAVDNVSKISELKDGDKVLIAEGCTHHRQCDDIGTVKIPAMLKRFTNADIDFDFCLGRDFPEELNQYSLVIQCGGCMLTDVEVKSRMAKCAINGVPVTNYGVALAYMNGILERTVEIFHKER